MQRRSSRCNEITESSLTETYQKALTRRGSKVPPPPSDAIEVKLFKTKGSLLGLTLRQHASGTGVLVTKLVPTVTNAIAMGKLRAGSVIFEVATASTTGGEFVPALHIKDVASLLRGAEGEITLKLSQAAVPDGWIERVSEKNEPFWEHREAKLRLHEHPAAVGELDFSD